MLFVETLVFFVLRSLRQIVRNRILWRIMCLSFFALDTNSRNEDSSDGMRLKVFFERAHDISVILA